MIVAFAAGALVFFGSDWLIDESGGAERKSLAGGDGGGSGTAISSERSSTAFRNR